MMSVSILLAGCTAEEVSLPHHTTPPPQDTATSGADLPIVEDIGLSSGLQDTFGGQLKRGRVLLSADFDDDGLLDLFIGSTNDPSQILRNVTEPGGALRFEMSKTVAPQGLFWSGSVGDLNNDGATDLFIGAAGSLAPSPDLMLLNRDPATLDFVDIAALAGPNGRPSGPGDRVKLPMPTSGVNWVDIDNDGWLDLSLMVNTHLWPDPMQRHLLLESQSSLWRNNRDGTFTELSEAAGLDRCFSCQHSVWFDVDQDGDMDFYENQYRPQSRFWRNLFVESGEIRFEDATAEWSLEGTDLRYPKRTFASAVADFNNDGWEDLIAFVRPPEPPESPHGYDGHALFLNVGGRGFVEVAAHTGLNDTFINWFRDHQEDGVMGCQVGDLNVDGLPDVFVGEGRPQGGTENQLLVSEGLIEVDLPGIGVIAVPRFASWSELINSPAEQPEDYTDVWPPYPYRTHGSVIIDLDRDGVPELAIANGGTAASPAIAREPNRLFTFTYDEPRRYLIVQPRGDGISVNRSGFGTRARATVLTPSGEERDVWGSLHSTQGYSANQGLEIFLGLADAEALLSLEIHWPDGQVDVVDAELDTLVQVSR